jgi:hypothetical protein
MKERYLKDTEQAKELRDTFLDLIMTNLHTISKDINAQWAVERIYEKFNQKLENYNGETAFLCRKIKWDINYLKKEYNLI